MPENSIYLDFNSTTPVLKEVVDAMLPYFSVDFGNPSSKTHAHGWIAAEAVKIAREQTAQLLGSEESEIIFTSGATESLNLAIQGLARTYSSKGKHIVSVATEHKAVLDVLKYLETVGFEVTILQVNSSGDIDVEELEEVLRDDSIAVICMLANNETGKVMPIANISEIAKKFGALLVCDATQAVGKMRVDVNDLGVDLLAISAHKFYGPKGVGALYIRRKNPRVKLSPITFGGGHESGLRPGTLALPTIVGLGKAAELSIRDLDIRKKKMLSNRVLFEKELAASSRIKFNLSGDDRLPNTINFRIEGQKADTFFSKLPLLSFSSGSACTSAIPEPSHVLKAMGLSTVQALESFRISIGVSTTEAEIKKAATMILQQL
ncbi:MAG: cysteine desulfurase family protein [Bacteroidia bacterium]